MAALIMTLMLASGSPAASCPIAGPREQVVERKELHLRSGDLEAVSTSIPGNGPLGFAASRVVIYGPGCRVVFKHRFPDTIQTRFSESRLGDLPVLILTTFEPGGSGCGYGHTILGYDGSRVRVLNRMQLGHSNMDGFYVGDLGGRRGPGLAFWIAIWGDGSHYDPHPYRVTIYQWRHGQFSSPSVRITNQRYDPSPDEVVKRLGFTFRDQTGQERFGGC